MDNEELKGLIETKIRENEDAYDEASRSFYRAEELQRIGARIDALEDLYEDIFGREALCGLFTKSEETKI